MLYVTSSPDDKYLSNPPEGVTPFLIGSGAIRTAFFSMLDVDVLAMTMPDLETFHIKRSPHGVHYVYIQHSIVSTHMVYREAAFDNFDTIFCSGPHHVEEIRRREALSKAPAKQLIEAGYCRLDAIMHAAQKHEASVSDGTQTDTVLVAPSWGPNGLIENHGMEVVETLIETGLNVIVRPHPRTIKSHGALVQSIRDRFEGETRFTLDTDPNAVTSLLTANAMVSDWSGAALEFGFGLLRPVLFVDVPRKVNNPTYEALEIEPIEVSVRSQMGKILPLHRLSEIGNEAQSLLADASIWREDLRAAREEAIFAPGQSGKVGARALIDILNMRRA
ncbi:MAG: CDP-glycerol glycerophosphotransferase family protein [Pseudomonadota bacterium]